MVVAQFYIFEIKKIRRQGLVMRRLMRNNEVPSVDRSATPKMPINKRRTNALKLRITE